jgi:hypothetical protein
MSGRLSFAVHYWLKRADRGELGGRDPYRPLVDDSLYCLANNPREWKVLFYIDSLFIPSAAPSNVIYS